VGTPWDCEALASDVLSAKILASWPAPEPLIVPGRDADREVAAPNCPAGSPTPVDRAKVAFDAGWATVLVPVCDGAHGDFDEFRLV
jgi:hypothetical protein